ncbi:unnamed protein product [Heligmosomoides polygyrus]|uniref:SCP domain-containing protein n=1 Tax=Heligmosomoides polygyrus TaxID=6339 RepID=A0A3P7Z1T7_HELPZ|nr:unnamed protein product [Heligmosomoides polygyrus]
MLRRLLSALVPLISCFLLVVVCTQERPMYMYATNKGMPINDREFLRSYNMHNLNLAALSRYGTVFAKRYS